MRTDVSRGPGTAVLSRLSLAVCCALLAVSCTAGLPAEFPAPEFGVKDVFTGKAITRAAYAGRPLLLYFFASW